MSSAVHSSQPPQPSKQWWSSALPHRPSKSPVSTPTTPVTTMSPSFDEKSLRATSKVSSRKFKPLASVMGFKSKKSHPTINIPSGPASPPLPFQNPPPPQAPSPASSSRLQTYSAGSSYQRDPISPGEPSIYTIPSSEEAFEPITPSDQLSRHRTSYQPSLFTFAEQQDQGTRMRFGGGANSRYMSADTRRISVMSDPSIIDPHMPREQAIRSSQVSASSYYPEAKAYSGRLSDGLIAHRDSLEKRKSSGESRLSKEVDLTLDFESKNTPRKPSEPQLRDYRHSDSGIPAVPKLSPSLLTSVQGPVLRKYPSANSTMLSGSGSKPVMRTGSPASVGSRGGKGTVHTGGYVEGECEGKDQTLNVRKSDSITNIPSSAHLSSGVRAKAASVSNGSLSGPGTGGRNNARPLPSIITSLSASSLPLSRNASVTSGTGSVVSSATGPIRRQPSTTRIRAVPPSRTPPPMSNLPPTPGSRPPSPLTFRSPRNASTSSLLNSTYSVTSEDPSILTLDLPPSTPSSDSGSSASLCFSNPGQASHTGGMERGVASSTRNRKFEARDPTRLPIYPRRTSKDDLHSQRPVTQPLHGTKASMSSGHTLMSSFGGRGETSTQRLLKKSVSQQSISANIISRGERQRVDSEASVTSMVMSDEGSSSMFGSVGKSLRKQRSMHNALTPAQSSLPVPLLPQQLRHTSSFNVSSKSGDTPRGNQLLHTRDDSFSSNMSSQRRSTPASASNSAVSTPTTPQMHKKRLLFSSHTRDRRDSNAARSERDKQDGARGSRLTDAQQNDKKKTHSIGLGLLTGHFSPSGPSSHAFEDVNSSRCVSLPPEDFSTQPPRSPVSVVPSSVIDQHILSPKELLAQMEALADTEMPSSPFRSADGALESELEDELSWDGSSIATTDRQSSRSRVNSVSGTSITYGWTDENSIDTSPGLSSPTSMTTRHFVSATGSIHGRLQNDRPSTASRLPVRNFSGLSGNSTSSGARPSTADPLGPIRRAFPNSSSDTYVAPTALPPPPRRKGTVVSSSSAECFEIEKPTGHLPPSFATYPSPRLQRLPSYEENPHLRRLPSHDTISTYNPNRGSIFRKPSFLDIGDGLAEAMSNVGSLASFPEDSFLILEHGKDSLDIGCASDGLSDGL
ncbi:hypothetical protein M0805_007173 [Coniferiporia weirii]|nr:hypothetical protein M0805_007173 [Coniferiporia weirii]